MVEDNRQMGQTKNIYIIMIRTASFNKGNKFTETFKAYNGEPCEFSFCLI